ncbi:regucalcin-like [Macrosteles quadrilineatus]|uniref:regucalcin-like n=1 Tax=Macrosteles quadrilineatus TaxID=74068 RepID=UPI0023E2795B|nr:regucalcin-like [Macrosteles quadrilineatus]
MHFLHISLAIVASIYYVHATDINIQQIQSFEGTILTGGLHWDAVQKRLYWVQSGFGTEQMAIVCYDPVGKVIKTATISGDQESKEKLKPLSMVIRVEGTTDKLLIGVKDKLAEIQWDCINDMDITNENIVFLDARARDEGERFNDGRADYEGRLWAGTITQDPKTELFQYKADSGDIYSIDVGKDSKIKVIRKQIINGFEWSLDKKKLYYIDSHYSDKYIVYQRDFTTDPAKETVLYNIWANEIGDASYNTPIKMHGNGMAIDNEGQLWVTVYAHQKIIRIDPSTGTRTASIPLYNSKWPTSLCFGGENLDILFVSTSRIDNNSNDRRTYPESGSTYMITGLGVKGAGPSRPVKVTRPDDAETSNPNKRRRLHG